MNNKPTKTHWIPFVVTSKKTLPGIKEILEKNWNILQINEDISKAFEEKPRIVCCRNKNLRDLIGQTTISNNKVIRKKNTQSKPGKCSKCNRRTGNQCCNQVLSTNTFRSQTTKEVFVSAVFCSLYVFAFYVLALLRCYFIFVVVILMCFLCYSRIVFPCVFVLNISAIKSRFSSFQFVLYM